MLRKGFTVVELVIVVVILGILASVALPKFFDMSADAKAAACKGALGGVRSAIANYYAYTATPTGGGSAAFPTITQLTTSGTVVEGLLPVNPYSTNTTYANTYAVVQGTTMGSPVTAGTTGAWCYKPGDGSFWCDTTTAGVNEENF